MTRSERCVPSLLVAAVVLTLLSCHAQKNNEADNKLVAALEARAETIRHSGGGLGFVCYGDDDNNVACVCDDDAPDDSIYSCRGMEKVCGRMGTGSICNPSTNWCSCVSHL